MLMSQQFGEAERKSALDIVTGIPAGMAAMAYGPEADEAPRDGRADAEGLPAASGATRFPGALGAGYWAMWRGRRLDLRRWRRPCPLSVEARRPGH